MPIPALSIVMHADDAGAQAHVIGVRQIDGAPRSTRFDNASLERFGVKGTIDEAVPVFVDGERIVFVGLGAAPTTADFRVAAGTGVRLLKNSPSVVIDFPLTTGADVLASLEGAAVGAYRFDAYKTGERSEAVREIAVAAGEATVPDGTVTRARILAEAVATTRDLANTPPNDLGPSDFAESVVVSAADTGLRVEVLDEHALAAEGFGGLTAVGKGSERPPRLVVIEYAPREANAHLALVGKGITFDSGGLSLKPAASMVAMKYDMTGAATVYSAITAIARLGLPVRVSAYLCLAENLPSGSATRPDDVIRIRGGKTVEVTNTDAEGRLVMADAIAYASEQQPDAIVDVATLTGAQVVALGDHVSGVMGNTEVLTERFLVSARDAGERVWPMPLPRELRGVLDSPIADIANAKIGHRSAGMLVAGTFLREFVGERDGVEIPWLHVDIAGPAQNLGGAAAQYGKGATGVLVRGLVAFAESFASTD